MVYPTTTRQRLLPTCTSNRAPSEWPDLFGNPLLASAGLDRLAHHAESVVITGRSFRAARESNPPSEPPDVG
jgi:DNA replication protein DnaC